ncbi:MAG TPA: hypothetical protein VMC09_09930 [Anaerolineales bacterium]|nr:hypothetical protein [Anaerolineales bacterium]
MLTEKIAPKRRPTWNTVGYLTLIALMIGILLGFLLLRQRIFLNPSLAGSTIYFYATVAMLPALITFFVTVSARPTGKRLMLVVLPILSFVMIIIYLTIIGPGLYTHIQCQADAGSVPSSHLDCSCQFGSSEGEPVVECVAKKLSPLPLIQLIEEK